MPQYPKPVEWQRRAGNPGKRPMPSLASVHGIPGAEGVPETLRPLDVEGRRMWERIWTSGQNWIGATTDIEYVQMACETLDERMRLRARIMSGEEVDRADRSALRALDDLFQKQLQQLGYTPVERSRIGVAEVKRASKIDEIMAARGA
jgi:hypothetical protein